ncbi:hypothetical protein ACO0RG_001304 [Hanseniaspora osmophila]|uniref:Altered inheritance of mitochondria protein 36, mitochondrial n=1 Tax=Hanseniaspora osmophila TaxID=56408 RepID=A0A1E5RN55_9ASCO|nr:Altered inheritance of mitochondria protein 36, mitochondrial [Hanseniaspora osmophila]
MLRALLPKKSTQQIKNLATQGTVARSRFHIRSQRCNSTASTNAQKKQSSGPGIKKIALVGLIGTAIFVQAAESLEKSKPKNSFTEEEYNTYVMNGLKRKKLMLNPESFPPIKFLLNAQGATAQKKLSDDSAYVVDPVNVVEYYRSNETSKYEALLNEIFEKNGSNKDVLPEKLPQGMICMLIGRYIQDHTLSDKIESKSSIIIKNFPKNLKEAIKFENDVGNVKSIIIGESDAAQSDIVGYYDTVKKVEK